ncbi:MAG: Rieske (2Fe-2S) protein [Pirellulales bacterium]|nr:Rieske (2Fe-2S) protein [Pirellulales bacterium]
MRHFQTVAKVGDIDDGAGAAFKVGDKMIAIFHVDGEYYAIDDFCPHMGASLGSGHLEEGTVTCPWHAWRFSVSDGTWVDNPKLKVGCYDVRVTGDDIQVAVPDEEAPPGYSPSESAADIESRDE